MLVFDDLRTTLAGEDSSMIHRRQARFFLAPSPLLLWQGDAVIDPAALYNATAVAKNQPRGASTGWLLLEPYFRE
jgi:hypothetical protein